MKIKIINYTLHNYNAHTKHLEMPLEMQFQFNCKRIHIIRITGLITKKFVLLEST